MKSVALIHTVKSVANTFEDNLRAKLSEDIKVYNLLDEFLAKHPNEIGEFTITNANRLLADIKNQELTGADLIVTTCSTLTPSVEKIRPFIETPIIAIDDAMSKKAVEIGSRILVMATAQSTIGPTCDKILNDASLVNKELDIERAVYMDAFKAMQAGDMETHDQILLENSKDKLGFDCIVLAQASMAHLEEKIANICGCPVLTSPRLCISQVIEFLNELN